MKKRILLSLLIVLLALGLWLLSARRGSSPARGAGSAAATTSVSSPDATDHPIRGNATPPVADAKLAMLRGLAQMANRPIEFYGQIIDQTDHPIPGVKIIFQVRYTKAVRTDVIGDSFDEVTALSDATGRFSLHDAKGSVLTVKMLEKTGYEPSPKATNRSYRYWDNEDTRFKPDAQHAEVFHMWKKAGGEGLVHQGISAALNYDGSSTTFDLMTGAKAESGDIRVTLLCDRQQVVAKRRGYEWTLTVEILHGGLIESNDEQMFEAPADGYQPRLTIRMPADSTDWSDRKIVNLYLQLRDGKRYGRVELKALIGADRETTPFYITSHINPTGSRNLE